MTKQFGAVGRSVCKNKKKFHRQIFFSNPGILSRWVGEKKIVRGHSVFTRAMSNDTMYCL